jgi:rhamnogalacturonan endolyase
MCRGYYAKTVIEAWDFSGNSLTKRWNFTAIPNGQNAAYAGQGNHSIAVADVDGDGKDEIIYGSCTIDDSGIGLYSSGFGHGDALHVGKFNPDRSGLQIFSCFESGTIQVALRDAANGSIIWRTDGTSNNDTGRCLTADIDPTSPGYEMWHSGNTSSIYAVDGTVLGKPLPTTAGGGVTYNLAIWWTGSLNRQLLDKATITSYTDGRIFSGGYDDLSVSTTNKEGLPFYGDIIGDWREEMIYAHNEGGIPVELRVFTTDYPCNYKFPYLMSNRHYRLSAAHQNIGYNQPTQIDYYIGSGTK